MLSKKEKSKSSEGNAPQVPACLALAPSLVTDSGTYRAAEPACTSQISSFSPERRVDVSQVGSLGGGWCSLPCCQRPIAIKCWDSGDRWVHSR